MSLANSLVKLEITRTPKLCACGCQKVIKRGTGRFFKNHSDVVVPTPRPEFSVPQSISCRASKWICKTEPRLNPFEQAEAWRKLREAVR